MSLFNQGSLRFLVIGDLHLGKGLDIGKPALAGNLPSRIQDRINLLDWCLLQAEEHQADTLILTGDIFEDVKPDYSLVEILFQFLNKCKQQIIIVVGNHELKRTGSQYFTVLDLVSSANFPHCQVVKDLTVLDLDSNTQMLLLPYRERGSFQTDSNPEAVARCATWIQAGVASMTASQRLAVGHLTLQGALYVGDEVSDLARELVMPWSAFDGLSRVWMGHVHKPQVLSEQPYLAHVGSLDISDFGETEQTKIISLFDTVTQKTINLPVPTRNLRKIQLEVPEDVEDPEAWVKSALEQYSQTQRVMDAIVRIEIALPSKYATLNRKHLEESIYRLGIHHLERVIEKRPTQSVAEKKTIMDASITPPAAFAQWATRYPEPFQARFLDAAHQLLGRI